MIIIGPDGKEVNAFIEEIRERMRHVVTWSEIREPTEAEIDFLKSTPCDHLNQKIQLVYDEHGIFYDVRSCAICDIGLGTV